MITILFILLVSSALWLHLIAAGLLARRWMGNYAVARIASIMAVCLIFFFLEHYVGLGPRLWFLPISIPLSAWLVWRNRAWIWENRMIELFFAAGFFYCLAWRCAFPDIDLEAERIPDLVFIQDYLPGRRLPAVDRWLPPFTAEFYYGFQHYSAALMGRWLGLSPGVCYQFAYSVLAGLVTCAAGAAAARLCPPRRGQWLVLGAVLVGGNGVIVALHVLLKDWPEMWMASRFLGMPDSLNDWRPLVHPIAGWIRNWPDAPYLELPMDTFAYALFVGEFHPPLTGFLLLAFSCLILAVQETGATGRDRAVCTALLAATVPLALIGNIWTAPLQGLLVGSWLIWRSATGEWSCWKPAAMGAAIGFALAYPHLAAFAAHPIADQAALRWTSFPEHSPFWQWLLMFWPVLGLLLLTIRIRYRTGFTLFLVLFWTGTFLFSEYLFNDDRFGGAWSRYNSTLKWWPWIYAGMTITLGALHLGSPSAWHRRGATICLLCMMVFAADLGRHAIQTPKPSALHLEGSKWIATDEPMTNIIRSLAARPDGIAIESGHVWENNETAVVSTFANKASLLGWPVHEQTLWRGPNAEVEPRMEEIRAFYSDELPDPLAWLLASNVRYVLWLPRNNSGENPIFKSLQQKISPHYLWRPTYGNPDSSWTMGYWERFSPSTTGMPPEAESSETSLPQD